MILLLHVITLIQSALGKQVSKEFLSFLNELLNAKCKTSFSHFMMT